MTKSIAIIGAGASGCLCAYFLLKSGASVTLFDKGTPLRTILPTGGGRCNLAHAEYDFRELAKNYPRGEKFLYSIFSKFSTVETLEIFKEMGINCYVQDNGRIFPKSDSAKEVRETILRQISSADILKEEVVEVKPIDAGFKVRTLKATYFYDVVIISTGGHSGYELVRSLGIKIIEPQPSLVGLNTKENFKALSGIVVKGCKYTDGKLIDVEEDLLFTHFGVSGPLIYTISSIKAFEKMPYKLNIDLAPQLIDLQKDLNIYPHKEIKNILAKYLPQKLASFVLNDIDETTKAHKINGKTRDFILKRIHNFEIEIVSTNKGEETVTAGGIDLDEINPKTLQFKKYQNLYAIGEVLNIDGFCGGFNLQNAWSTAYICSQSLIEI